MDVRFDAEENCEVLVYKRTGKTIVPIEEFEPVVRKVHSEGHYDAKKTLSLVCTHRKLIKKYSVSFNGD